MKADAHLDARSIWATVRALAGSCHPAPIVGVTAIAVVLAAIAGNTAVVCVLVGLAILTGQLSIGWSNDLIDARRDAAVGRTDKPIAAGAVAVRTVRLAIAASIVATVIFSVSLGWRAGTVQLVAVALGWSYNLGLKKTAWSWLPFVLAFGLLPAVATLALADPRWPAWWATTAAALLGVSSHFSNVLPDRSADLATGVRGLPHRLGARWAGVVGPSTAAAASVLAVFGPPGSPKPAQWPVFGAALLVAAIAAWQSLRNPTGKLSFYCTMAVAGLDVLLLALGGHRLG